MELSTECLGRIAKGFSDPEIEAIAVWFGAQPQ